MKRKSILIIFLVILIVFLAVFILPLFRRSQQIDLSYDPSSDNLVIYSNMRWYAGVPLPPEPECLGQAFPSLRVWGDGLVFFDSWSRGLPEPRYRRGQLNPEQIHSILTYLASEGFFGWYTPEGPNPAGTSLEFGANLNKNSVKYSTGDMGPYFYYNLINQIMPQLQPVDIKLETDKRIISLVAEIQSCIP